MNDFESVAKQYHRKAPLTVAQKDADFSKKDKEQAKQKLKEETKGETLGEWYAKKQKEADADLITGEGKKVKVSVPSSEKSEEREKAWEQYVVG